VQRTKNSKLSTNSKILAFVKLLTISQALHNHQKEEDTELAVTAERTALVKLLTSSRQAQGSMMDNDCRIN
jgi:hypothetical protein